MPALFSGNTLRFYPRRKKYQNMLKNIRGYEEGKHQLFLTAVLRGNLLTGPLENRDEYNAINLKPEI